MTIALLLTSITGAIDDISVSGVAVRNYDGIVGNWQSQPNVLYPNPEGYIEDFSIDFKTLLRGAAAPQDVSYTLNYRLLGAEIGDLSMMPRAYGELVDKLALVLNAFMAVDAPYSNLVEMEVQGVSVGPRQDPAGNYYFGADIALRVTEMQNA